MRYVTAPLPNPQKTLLHRDPSEIKFGKLFARIKGHVVMTAARLCLCGCQDGALPEGVGGEGLLKPAAVGTLSGTWPAEPVAHTNHPPPSWRALHQAPGRAEFLWKLEPALPAGPGWLGVGAAPSHLVWTTWAWRGSDSWRVQSWRWPEPFPSQPALGLGAAACSRLRWFIGGLDEIWTACGWDASEAWGHQAGQKVHTLRTQTRREWLGPGRP